MFSSSITDTLAREHARELRDAARAAGTAADARPAIASAGITIRLARDDDARALATLADLDSRRLPSGDVVVAEVGGELRAAVGIAGGEPIADPFHATAGLVSLLAVRAQQLRSVMAPHAAAPRRARHLVPVANR